MLKNLGKFIVILSIPFVLLANVKLEAPKSYFQGESVEFSISANGEDVVIPDIKKIGNLSVRTLGTSSQLNIFNSKRTTTIVKTFAFSPKGDVTIPSFEVKADGKIQKTKPKKVTMVKVEKTVSNLYRFDLKVDKNEAYVGEAIGLTIDFKCKKDLPVLGLELEKPDFEGFWVKKLDSKTFDDDPEYFKQTLRYLIFPQKAGKVELGSFRVNVVVSTNNYSNSFFSTGARKTIPVYSNRVKIDIKELPRGISLIGKFEMESFVDKQSVKAGEAVSYKLKIKGEGNIDDIVELKPNIPDVTLYDNPAKKEFTVKEGVYSGEYSKVFSIVASKDFTIPPITVEYFDKESNSVKILQTKEYKIKVQQEQKSQSTVLQTAQPKDSSIKKVITVEKRVQGIDILHEIFFLLGGVFTLGGVFIYKFFQSKKRKKKEDTPLIVTVKKTKTPQELLKVIVNYINIDKDLDKIIYRLESTHDIKEFSQIKKEVVKIVKNMEISTL